MQKFSKVQLRKGNFAGVQANIYNGPRKQFMKLNMHMRVFKNSAIEKKLFEKNSIKKKGYTTGRHTFGHSLININLKLSNILFLYFGMMPPSVCLLLSIIVYIQKVAQLI